MAMRPYVDRLAWDDWNRDHIAKHAVLPEEAEEAVAGNSIFRAGYKRRFVVTGPTVAGRMLTVVIGEDPSQPRVYYVFSARPASREERADYRQEKGELKS
jgi:uncharacterized DUF497 family protein